MTASVEVIKPGIFSTFQDLGRFGYQRFGVPVNGVMDERSHRLANLLVGNSAKQATLEVTLIGPSLLFQRTCDVAICGADLTPMVDGAAVPMNQLVHVEAGAVLSFGRRLSGVRSYLAVRGGFDLDAVMGSSSTYVRGGYGGWQGRALRKGDTLPLCPAIATAQPVPAPGPVYPPELVRPAQAPIRIVSGREWALFSPEAHRALVEQPYRIAAQSDRMGFRLEGQQLALSQPKEMLSEAVSFGTMQVPPDGQPIILMADRQTTGGYPKIAQVIHVDLPKLAQMMPGEILHFELITLNDAQRLKALQADIFSNQEFVCNPC